MKKLALLLFAMLMATPFFSQGHLKFCEVPIDGHIDAFVTKMKQKGYTEIEREDEMSYYVVMKGKISDKDVELCVKFSPTSKTVYAIIAYAEGATTWNSLKPAYENCKEAYTKKYVDYEVEVTESFTAPYREGDGREMKALEEFECTYKTTLRGDQGEIAISIDNTCRIAVTYTDLANEELNTIEWEDYF